MNYNTRTHTTSLLVITALVTALTTIATMFFRIPVSAGYIHLGDTLVLLGAMLLPRKYALFSGGVGAALADIIGGYAAWAPFTLVIKMLMVLILGAALTASEKCPGSKKAASPDAEGKTNLDLPHSPAALTAPLLAGIVLAGIETVAGYYAAEGILYGNWTAPWLGVPFNALQVLVGAVLAILIYRMLEKTPVVRGL